MRKLKGWMPTLAFGLVLAGLVGCPAQVLTTWFINVGGGADEEGFALAQTRDGGFIVAGATEADAPEDSNALLMKVGPAGRVVWQAEFGDEREDIARAVAQTDDGFVLAGQFGGWLDTSSDAFLIKTNPNGAEEWRKLFDSGGQDEALSVLQTSDGGYLVGVEFDLVGTARAAMIKTAPNGETQWQIDAGEHTHLARAVATADGGYALGWWQVDGIAKDTAPISQLGILKVDASGQEVLRKSIALDVVAELEDIRTTPDGGFILAGETDLFSDDSQVMLWKTDATGTVEWQQTFGRGLRDRAHVVRCTEDGGYVVLGTIQPSQERTDIYLAKIDANGNVIWERAFGGDDSDYGYDMIEVKSGFAITGTGESFEKENESDNREIIVARLDRFGHCREHEVALPEPPGVEPDHYQLLSFRAPSHLLTPDPQDPQKFTIRLTEVAPYTTVHRVYADLRLLPPGIPSVRQMGVLWDTVDFPELWDDLGYHNDPPEAGLLVNSARAVPTMMYFRLSNPRHDADEGDLLFDATLIDAPTRPELQMLEDGWVNSPKRVADESYLFITEINQPAYISDDQFQAEVLDSDVPVVVVFVSDWYVQSNSFVPVVKEVAAETSGVKFVFFDLNSSAQTPRQWGLLGIPTSRVYSQGQIVAWRPGWASKERFSAWVAENVPRVEPPDESR